MGCVIHKLFKTRTLLVAIIIVLLSHVLAEDSWLFYDTGDSSGSNDQPAGNNAAVATGGQPGEYLQSVNTYHQQSQVQNPSQGILGVPPKSQSQGISSFSNLQSGAQAHQNSPISSQSRHAHQPVPAPAPSAPSPLRKLGTFQQPGAAGQYGSSVDAAVPPPAPNPAQSSYSHQHSSSGAKGQQGDVGPNIESLSRMSSGNSAPLISLGSIKGEKQQPKSKNDDSWLFYDTEGDSKNQAAGNNAAGQSQGQGQSAYLQSVNSYQQNSQGVNSFSNLQANSHTNSHGSSSGNSQNSQYAQPPSSARKLGTFQQLDPSGQYGSTAGVAAGPPPSQSSYSNQPPSYGAKSQQLPSKQTEKRQPEPKGTNEWLFGEISESEMKEHNQQVDENIAYTAQRETEYNLNLKKQMELQQRQLEDRKNSEKARLENERQQQHQQARQKQNGYNNEVARNRQLADDFEHRRQEEIIQAGIADKPKHFGHGHHTHLAEGRQEAAEYTGFKQKNPPSDVQFYKKWYNNDYSSADRNLQFSSSLATFLGTVVQLYLY